MTKKKCVLKLFVTGQTPNSIRAIANLKKVLEQDYDGLYELIIIDVQENPQMAEDERIIATPTLSRVLPLPIRRIIGDLSEKDKVLLGLELL